MPLNENFGFTRNGINQRVLAGPVAFRQYFPFLQRAYWGLIQGPMVSDLFQAMNPEEILAAATGWATVARDCSGESRSAIERAEEISRDAERFYSRIVSIGFANYGRILNNIRATAEERGVAPFTTSKGDLSQRVREVFGHRQRVREILIPEKVQLDLEKGLNEEDGSSDVCTKGIANRSRYTSGIVKYMENKYDAFREKRSVEFYLGEARIALAQDNHEEIEHLLCDRLPIMLEKADDADPRIIEYNIMHDSVYKPTSPRTDPPC